MDKPFKLSCSLYGHSMDVRALAVNSNNVIISGSRDKSAKLWKQNGSNNSYHEDITYKDQKNFVASVLYLEPSNIYPDGLVVTGGNDNQLLIYKPTETFAIFVIKEHTDTVSCLSKGLLTNAFVSGSWDLTAKYWVLNNTSTQTSSVTLKGHTAAIWSVLQLQDSRLVTASADKSICIWTIEGQLMQTLNGHTDCVRGLCDLPDSSFFVSVANDATVKLWSYRGENIETLYGHANYIYSVTKCKSKGNCFVTSDEDGIVKVWYDGVNVQSFKLPAKSIWAVASLNNGDIVTGSSDGVIRIFTQDDTRIADSTVLAQYENDVKILTEQNSKEIGGYKLSDLPGIEALYNPGVKDGQMLMIKENEGAVAYTWKATESRWEKIGDVIGSKQEEGKTLYEGKNYDFVFSVDVEDGKPPLKLPYNIGDDPYKTAQNFLTKNALPSVYLEQVVDFILKNSKTNYTPAPSNNYVDPFTGGSRYTPSGTNITEFQGTNVDPFTGGSSYSTSSSSSFPKPISSTGSNADPFTGSMSYTTQKSNYFPQQQYLSFDMGDPTIILNKLKEFNGKIGDGSNTIEENHLIQFVSMCKTFPENPDIFELFYRLLEWPEDMIFPVLDVIRMAVRNQENNDVIATLNSRLLMDKLKYFISDKCTVINNTIVALRTLCNLCLHGAGESLIYENRFDIVENITSLSTLNKNGQVALSTLLLNLTILSGKKNDDLGISVLTDVLQDIIFKLSDPESQFRSYVAIGNLLIINSLLSKEIRLKFKTNMKFMELLENHSTNYTDLEKKRSECIRDIKKLL